MSNTYKLIIKNHKHETSKYNNEFHGKFTKIFKIIEKDSLGFVETNWCESFEVIPNTTKGNTPSTKTSDWLLVIGGESLDAHILEEILNLKNVEEYEN